MKFTLFLLIMKKLKNAREKMKIKKEKELILESESTGRLTRSKKKNKIS
jgi:hypothetical protein